jgi:hypothetical protein
MFSINDIFLLLIIGILILFVREILHWLIKGPTILNKLNEIEKRINTFIL